MTATPSPRTRHIVFVVVLAGLMCLHASMILGPLAMDLPYDDVVYAIDGAQRLGVLERNGLGAFLAGLWNEPPHSPFSTLLAVFAFWADCRKCRCMRQTY